MFKLLKVRGDSLVPEYRDGDFVLVSKIPILFGRFGPGDVVAFHHPQYGMLIKQITAIGVNREELIVTGSHPSSVDSRQFGPIRRTAILGRVVAHIRKPR